MTAVQQKDVSWSFGVPESAIRHAEHHSLHHDQHNDIVVLMLPSLIEAPGHLEGILPPGLHHVSLREVREAFAYNDHRAWLFAGFIAACRDLREFGCGRIYLGGSYVTSKEYPGDYDACWDPVGVSDQVSALLWDDTQRLEQNRKYRGDLLVSAAGDGPECRHYQFLSRDKVTGLIRGMIGIKLNMLEILNV